MKRTHKQTRFVGEKVENLTKLEVEQTKRKERERV